jgi:hypothetical protein
MDHSLDDANRSGAGFKSFLSEALLSLGRRDLLLPGLILLVLLTLSNIVILQNMPGKGEGLGGLFAVAAVLRVAGLLLIAAAILRTLTSSPRSHWLPDGGFWLYTLTFAAGVAATGVSRVLIGDDVDFPSLIASNVLLTLLLSPFLVWFTAVAVARPLAWRLAPWLKDIRRWWPAATFWTLLLVMPMAVLHGWIDMRLVKGVGDGFWPLALFDGALSTAMALISLSLNAAAYRRVAQAPSSRLSAGTDPTSMRHNRTHGRP